MGAFDDLIPKAPAAVGGGNFDDLIPKAPMPSAGPSGGLVLDDGTVTPETMTPLVKRFQTDPRVQDAMAIQRGTWAGEAAAAAQMVPEAWRNTVLGSFVESGRAGLPMAPEAARLREVADLQQPQVQPQTPFQQHMAQQLNEPGIYQSPADMQARAGNLEQEGAARLADYQENRLPELAAAEAVPSFTTADSTLGKIAGALVSGGSLVAGSAPSPESFVPVSRGATVARTFLKGAAANGAVAGLTDPYSQSVRIGTGAQSEYSPEQTALSIGLGGALGGGLNIAPEAWAGARGLLQRRGQAPVLPGQEPGVNADDLFRQAQTSSEGSAVMPDETQSLVNRMTGVDLPPSATMPAPGQRLTPEQYAARRQTESELADLFNRGTDINPGGSVRMGDEGPVVADGALPVRDPTGAQANVDTLAQLREAEALMRKHGIEPDAGSLQTFAKYQEQGLSPLGAINAFKRARTAEARADADMTPPLERTAGEKANADQRAKEAFDIANARRERREKDLGAWEPELQADYGAGAPRLGEATPRMEQDLAARSQAPAPGTSTIHPEPRRSVDVIGSKSVGGLRGEFQPGERPTPEAPVSPGRTGETFEGERVEPRLDGPEPAAPREPAPGETARLGGPEPEPAPVAGSADDILDRAFKPREQPAETVGPDLDHLTPDQQRRAVNLEHEIATAKAFDDPPESIAALQAERDALVSGRASESAQAPRDTEPTPTVTEAPTLAPADVLDTLDRELAGTRWDEKGGKLLRADDGKVSRSKWLSSNPDIQSVLSKYQGITAEKARNLIARAKSGKGKPLTERQQQLVTDLTDAVNARNERAPAAPRQAEAPAPKPAEGKATDEDALRKQLERFHPTVRNGPDGPRMHAAEGDAGVPLPLTDAEKARHKALGEEMKSLYGAKMTDAQQNRHADLHEELRDLEREGAARYLGKKSEPEQAPDLELKSETESERAARQQKIKDKTAEQAASRKRTEDKAQADKDRDDFKLSGSDREADVAASHGQGTLLDIGAVPGQAVKPLKALYRRLFHGSDESSMKETASDLATATRDMFKQERPTKRGAVADTVRRVWQDADNSLRNLVKPFKGDIGEQIADALHVQSGDKKGKGASLDERRQQQMNPRLHDIEDLDAWMRKNKMHTPEAQAQIIKLVENPDTPRRGLLGEAAKKVEAFYKDMHKYQTEAGVELGNVKGYFQRVLDNGEVGGHRGKFITAAKKAYKQDNPRMSDSEAQDAAEKYWEREVNGDVQKPGTASRDSGGATPQHMKSRAFSKAAAKHLDAFYVKEIPAMLASYLHRAVQRAEIAKTGVTIDGKFQPFGDNFKNWETITDAMRKQDPEVSGVMPELNNLVATGAGITDSKLPSTVRNTLGAVRTATTLGSMEKSALASMTELMTPSMRAATGDLRDIPSAIKAMGEHAYNAVRTAVGGKSGRSNKLQNNFNVASAAGIIGGSGQHSLMAARASAGEPTQRATSVLLSKFFGRNGLEHLTNYQRATATGQAMDFLKYLSAPGRQGKAKNSRFLGELGIPEKDQGAFTKWVRDLGDKQPTPADLKGPMAAKYKTAMLRFVDQAIQRPSPSTRPAWSSTPLGSTVFQLQSFNYAAQKNIINRMGKVLADKDLSVAERAKMGATFLGHMAALTGISAAVWEGRDALYSRPDSRELTTGAKIERAVSGAGLLGKYDQIAQAVGGGVRYGASPTSGLGGPGLSNASRLIGDVSALSGPNNSPNTNTAERKAARTAYQTVAEPLLQAALTPIKASPVGLGLTAYGVPKAGEKLVDALMPANAANKKELPPVEGALETIADKFSGKGKKDSKAAW